MKCTKPIKLANWLNIVPKLSNLLYTNTMYPLTNTKPLRWSLKSTNFKTSCYLVNLILNRMDRMLKDSVLPGCFFEWSTVKKFDSRW